MGKRFRDVGDVSSLAESIFRCGLLHPIICDANLRLVAGARRLAAVKALGWTEVPVRVVNGLTDAAAAIRAERAIARALEPLEAAEAKARQKHGGRPKNGSTKRSGRLPDHSIGTTRDRVGRAVGVSGKTLAMATAVVEAAEREPLKYAGLLRQMDSTGNMSGSFLRLRKRQAAERLAAQPPPPPTGPFDVIVVDPGWPYPIRDGDVTQRGNTH
ncbi:MAG TPA: ParB N-terminal domain-containing protein [Vicinamibacterales bacterium]